MRRINLACLLLLAGVLNGFAENGYQAWLRYEPVAGELPAVVVALGTEPVLQNARDELVRGVRSMLGRTPREQKDLPPEDFILLGTLAEVMRAAPDIALPASIAPDGYLIRTTSTQGRSVLLITAANDRGVLYGVFDLLRRLALVHRVNRMDELSVPYTAIRWTNEWDNLDGSIERGYAGRSIFFDQGNVVSDMTRARDYARLLASVGINGCTVNNVNANPRAISTEFVPQLARIADAFRPWGVKLSVSVDFSSPKLLGHLDTFDPLDAPVAAWWKRKADELYRAIPDLAGILVKADSEGRVGPSAYGRTHADAANVIARALKPHGGVLIYRGFVYDHHMDWRNLKNDRARAAYDNFAKLDGQFDDNVLVQIKHGPIDFQVREPVSPLLGALKHTNETLEVQVTQEYTGQQRQLCFLAPMWKEVLQSQRPKGGMVAVANVGLDRNWLGHDLAMANLYGFGRLAWNPDSEPVQIADEWTRLTFGNDPEVAGTISKMELRSWHVYEDYTGPLGVGGLTDIIGVHYGPGIESSERNGWGQWHRADANGIGMDRTVATGTGFTGQYAPAVASMYESLETCPDSLLLFMHHVPYTHVLHSGKTVIQHIYDSHYEGAQEAQSFAGQWQRLRGRIDEDRYEAVLKKLRYQAGFAVVWRDAVCNWFFQTSRIEDAKGRVGQHPGRFEAESMSLDGYTVQPVTPWETASGGKAVGCPRERCAATLSYHGKPGWYDVVIQYFDQNNGAARFQLSIQKQLVSEWTADETLPSGQSNGHTSTRHVAAGIALRPGDEIQIAGLPDSGERAVIDYIEIRPMAR